MVAVESAGNNAMHSSMERRGRMRAAFDHDLRAQADMGQQSGEVADGIGFRDVNRCHIHDDTSIPVFGQMARSSTPKNRGEH
jgi:hypothetical protein